MIKAIIFDLDGLMIDSEKVAIQAWQYYLKSLGVSLAEEQYMVIVGADHAYSLEYIRQHAGIEIDRSELDNAFWANIFALFERDGLEPMSGVLPLLKEISARGIQLGVASNSPTDYVHKALEKIGVKDQFNAIIGVDQVAHGKPAPDVYLRAATCLGMTPDSCLAIEDTMVGAQAALAAGMPCILVPNPLLGKVDLDEALTIYPTLDDLLQNLNTVLTDKSMSSTDG